MECATTCCITPTYEEVMAAVVSAREKTDKISTTIVNDLFYQYGYCERPEHHVLQLYAEAANSHLNQLSAGVEPCLNCDQIRNVVEGIRTIVGVFCACEEGTPELQIDKSQFAQWAVENPYCVPFKTWEAAIYAECNRVGMRVVAESLDLTCQRVVLHRRATEVLCKIPHKKLVEEILCDFDLNIKPIAIDCEVQYKLLPEDITCQITIEQFATLIDCGLSVNLIADCIDCGLGFNITPTSVDICESEALTGVEAVDCCETDNPITITTPEFIIYPCTADAPSGQSLLDLVSASGGCGELTIFIIGQFGTGPCPTSVTSTYIAVDACLNTSDLAYWSYVVSDMHVEESECETCPPEDCSDCDPIIVTGPEPLTVVCLEDVPAVIETESTVPVTFAGGCGVVNFNIAGEQIVGTCPSIITRTYTAFDFCGNTVEFEWVITANASPAEECETPC